MILFALALEATQPLLENEGLFVQEDYPVEALQKGVEGTVHFVLDVGPSGRATVCRIEQTSGSELLDQMTCRLALRRAKFRPAQDENGKPTTGSWASSATWRHHPSPEVAWSLTFQSNGSSTICLASNGKTQRKVRTDICRRMVAGWLKDHVELPRPDQLTTPLSEDLLEPVAH